MPDHILITPAGPHLQTVAMPCARVVTGSIAAMRFLRPVEVGDKVSCCCSLAKEGDTSIAVNIETWTRSRDGSEAEKVTKGVFTCVALGEDGKPHPVE